MKQVNGEIDKVKKNISEGSSNIVPKVFFSDFREVKKTLERLQIISLSEN
jgi:hypothetical protein